jgi:putative restriction endonuclease
MDGVEIVVCEASGEASFGGSRLYLSNREKVSRFSGVITDYSVEVSRRIKEQFQNGKDYYPLHGQRLMVLPDSAADRPNRESLGWHNSKVYLG